MTVRIRAALIAIACLALGTGCTSSSQQPQTPSGGEAVFTSHKAAVAALVAALRANDTEELRRIFGPAGDQIIWSGDPVADKLQIERFLAAYDERHRLQTEGGEGGGVTTLLIGLDDWPFPVPLVRADGGYVFDAAAGEEEILNRRIGRNELAAEQVCLAIVDAQHEYAETRPMGGDLRQYARQIMSDPGRKNGLYWPTAEGERPSPLGPLVTSASGEGYGAATRPADASPPPYHGYYFRLLTSQGPSASGGAMDYLVDGRLIGGFGVIAYPATYGNSGVMTFMTNHDGVLYERDLGPDSAKVAKSMTSFDPGPEWKRSKGQADPPAVQLTSQP
jgi:hypothetical protein